MRLWVADGEKGLICVQEGKKNPVGLPAEALCAGGGCVYCAGRGRCACYDPLGGAPRFETAAAPGVCVLCAWGETLYALSCEADSVTAFSARTGEIICCAPAGAYPRDLKISPGGKVLAAAGGASGEIHLLDRDLCPLRIFRVPGTVCGVCFQPRGLWALCAVEDGDLSARLYAVSRRGVTEEVFSSPLTPSCLCPLPGGGCALGLHGEIRCLKANQKTALRRRCSCPVRIRAGDQGIWVCDAGEERVFHTGGKTLYHGPAPMDALLFPD